MNDNAGGPFAPRLLRFGAFELDARTAELRKHGDRIRLQDQPARLLIFLASRPGVLVTREEIQTALWEDGRFVEFDHAINTAVRKIRDALEDDTVQPRWIETLPRKGYRFIGPVEEVTPAAPPAESRLPAGPDAAAVVAADPPAPDDALIPRTPARALFLVIQLGYLALYSTVLIFMSGVEAGLSHLGLPATVALPILILAAMCGIAVRLYLASSVGLRHPEAGAKFLRLFPFLLALDGFWAASPLLASPTLGLGLALAVAAGLAYLPFSQRTLIRNIYAGAD